MSRNGIKLAGFPRKLGTMPIYQFIVRSGDHEDDPGVRWPHLPDESAARRYGHLLIKDFKSSGRNPNSSHLYVVVKDEMETSTVMSRRHVAATYAERFQNLE